MMLRSLSLALGFALNAVAPQTPPPATVDGRAAAAGTYVAKSLNHRALPAEERIASADGFSHWVRIEQVILRLQSNGQFAVSMKYFHEHLSPKERPVPSQLLAEANRGTYLIRGNEIEFQPARGSSRAAKPVSAIIRGGEIEVRFRVREGDHWRPMTFIAARDRSYW